MNLAHLGQLLTDSVAAHPARPALRVRRGDDWEQTSYAELGARVATVAEALLRLGVQHGDRVAIFATNRPEWTVADLATLLIGGVVVPVYQTSTARQARHVLGDAGVSVAFVGGAAELDKVAEVRAELPALRTVIGFEEVAGAEERTEGYVAWRELIAQQPVKDPALENRMAAVTGSDLATIIYTSGTTGDPRGVMLTHEAFCFEIEAVRELFEITPTDQSLCFLPLAHALERAWTFVVLRSGALNTYLADATKVAEMLPLAKPSLLVSVPRLYERVYAIARQRASSPAKRRVFDWAIKVGARAQAAGELTPRLRAELRLADKLVLSGIRTALGGQKRVLASGGAPLRAEIEEFFHAAGLLICQGYGLTEAAPLISFNSPQAFRFGTVGRVVAGGEVRIAEDGEVCYRGPNVMNGYWNRPDATAETLIDGWLHTGDIGGVDDDGFLTITDRKKDLLVTEGGKNIAPGPIEGELAADPLVEHAVLLGDGRPCVVALLRPSLEEARDWAAAAGVSAASDDELVAHPELRAELKRRADAVSDGLPHQEKIRAVAVITEELTMADGLLTPTLKVRRRAVEQRYAAQVEELYTQIRERKK
ncbi:AMP-dependent synthetase/ligase [Enemella evansiae]|uniref:Long-chain fatty acid--CoA ligase n=1 Tax=Enemella evansiae TaxID=2016499 RepID=A0A255GKT4_9ACTN|nr:long-chain fatty acid--CoA ligase [Enemella evansiae]OYO16429.1 long-chain fatty acid--CoA ligase [Enemella evansiae]TDO91833.1 long-chain acyl-CoA synthetase [Enemella evansiae]